MNTLCKSVSRCWALGIVATTSGCVSAFPEYPVRPATSYQHHLQENGIIVAAHPLKRASEQREYFDANLNRRDILPVFVVVENHNPQTSVLVSKEDFGLCDASDAAVEDLLPSGVAGKVIYVGGAALLSIPFMAIGGAITADAENIKHNYLAKELSRQMLGTHEATSGFVYFPLSEEPKNADRDLVISARLTMLPSNQQKVFLLRIQGKEE